MKVQSIIGGIVTLQLDGHECQHLALACDAGLGTLLDEPDPTRRLIDTAASALATAAIVAHAQTDLPPDQFNPLMARAPDLCTSH